MKSLARTLLENYRKAFPLHEEFTCDNMSKFLGSECTDEDAEILGNWLKNNGYELQKDSEGNFDAYKDGEKISEVEYQDILKKAFD